MLGRLVVLATALLSAALLFAGPAGAATFSNTDMITVPGTGDSGPADPYPSQISVEGAGPVTLRARASDKAGNRRLVKKSVTLKH